MPFLIPVKIFTRRKNMNTYDRNRNAIATGSMVMVADSGATGVIKAIHAEGKTAEQLRRADCVEIDGHQGLYCPLNLIRLGFNNRNIRHQYLTADPQA
jgi:putative selenium-binding protein YdfZ